MSRHADIHWALKATGDAFRGPTPGELARYFPRAATSLSLNLLASTLAMKDPPTHTRLRRLISRDFTRRQIDNLRPSIARIVAARLDGMASTLERGEVVDLHREFALALPMLVFAELFGLPQDDMFGLAAGIGAILEGLSPHASDPQLAAADAASARVQAYFGDLIQRKRTDPCHDIVSMLVGAHDDDADTLSDAELISMLWGMLLGGFATTAATIDHAVLAMLAYPEQRHWLQGDAVGASERARNNSGQSYRLRGLHGPPFCRRKPLPRLPKVTLVARARTASLCFSASVSIATKAVAVRVRTGAGNF